MADAAAGVTTLLRAWIRGDQRAFDELTPLVYDELRRRARQYLRGRAGESHAQAHGAGP
jgi:hypothetical protein